MEIQRRFRKNYIRAYLVLFLLFAFCSSGLAEEDWHLRKSTHFIVHYKEAKAQFIDKLMDRSENCYREITQELGFFRKEPWLWEKRALIYVFNDKDKYLKETNMPAWSGGCSEPFEKKIYTFSESYDFFKYTLTHELTHLIFREYIGTNIIPLWLDEGIAIYMERKNEASSLVGKIKMIIDKGANIDFNEFFEVEFQDLDKKREALQLEGLDYVTVFYIQSFSLVYFLIKEYDKHRFTRFLRLLRDGEEFRSSFFSIYGVAFKDLDILGKKWLGYYR